MKNPSIQWHTVVSQPFEENTYVVHRPASTAALIIDPGLEPDKIVELLERERLQPEAILITHGHSDHIGGNAALKEIWPDCPIVIGRLEADKLTDPELNLSAPFGFSIVSPPADRLVDDQEVIELAGCQLRVLHIPGHSSGHVVYVWGDPAEVVFGGDVLFRGSVGRCDLPDGDFQQLRDHIHRKLFTLPEDCLVLPGHGPPTRIGDERRENPFVGGVRN